MEKILKIAKATLNLLFVISRDVLCWMADRVASSVDLTAQNTKKNQGEDEPDWTKAGIDPTYCELTGKKFHGYDGHD